MPQPRGQAEFDFSPVALYRSSSPMAAWENVILPWFGSAAVCSTRNRLPVCVVLPQRAIAQQFRARLVRAGLSSLGIRFFVPAELREFLHEPAPPRVPLREHLRLLLAVAAEQCAREFEHDGKIDNVPIANAVAREPDELLRAIDAVAASGAEASGFRSDAISAMTNRFREILARCESVLVGAADRLLLQQHARGRRRFSKLLICGFDGAHWPLWPLLHATAVSAENTTVILREPRDQAAELDRVWITTWEEQFEPARDLAPAAASSEQRFEFLLTLPETAPPIASGKTGPRSDVHFLIGRDTNEQAGAIVALAVSFLSEQHCERVAILLPGPGALARLVASWLERLQISHNDAIAHPMRGPFDTEEWRAWLELQEQPRLGPLLRFLEHSPAASTFFAPLSLRKIRDTLQRACGDMLINSVDVLAEYCRRRIDEPVYPAVAKSLAAIRFLPERATFAQYVDVARSIFRELDWKERAAELDRLSRGWSEGFDLELSRERFLRWLTEIFADSALLRDQCGHHPYARVQLLRYDQAENETWSHVIFAGLNEGAWPPRDDESSFLSDDEIAELNRKNTRQSRFGEGQSSTRAGTALCLGARDRRALALRQLLNTIESTTGRIAAAAQLYTQSPREQAVNPSEFFARLFFSARGEALSQRNIEKIHEQTRDWLAQLDLFDTPKRDNVDLTATAHAYRERRRSDTTFNDYDFAFRQDAAPREQIALSATDAANLLKWPALVWMKTYLRVTAGDLDTGSWSLATGQWVHRWLALMGAPRENRFVPRIIGDEAVRRVTAAADNFRAEILSILQACDRTGVPDWWLSGWRNARHLAENFAAQVAPLKDWPQIATEWTLDSPHIIPLNNGGELRVTGRIDLILARAENSDQLWIVDYKTGTVAKPLKSHARDLRKQLVEGDGVQICIYAVALQSRAKEIDISLLTRDGPLAAQIGLDDVHAQSELWLEIARMQRTGVFGTKGELRSEFTFTPAYPLAMLSIDKDLLREKWERTHPAFARSAHE